MSQILENLYIASVEETFKDEKLKSSVTHFLNVASEIMITERVNHIYKKIAITDDDENNNITYILDDCIEWIHQVLQNGGIICIHCLEGKSRSVCVCIAYMCYYLNMKYEEAFNIIISKRNFIDIFPLYEKQLREYINDNLKTQSTTQV